MDEKKVVQKLATSAGAVVVSRDGQRVLLRRPRPAAGFPDGWTHAKGRPDEGEDLPTAALREVREELGAEVELAGEIEGTWAGEYTDTKFYLARFVRVVGPFDDETEETAWFRWEHAAVAIAGGTSPKAVARDLTVLERAMAATDAWRRASN